MAMTSTIQGGIPAGLGAGALESGAGETGGASEGGGGWLDD